MTSVSSIYFNPELERKPLNLKQEEFESLKESLKCSICLETAEDPWTLPCQHIFCSKCIYQHCKSKVDSRIERSLPGCPNCRTCIDVRTLVLIISGKEKLYCSSHSVEISRIIYRIENEKPMKHDRSERKMKSFPIKTTTKDVVKTGSASI